MTETASISMYSFAENSQTRLDSFGDSVWNYAISPQPMITSRSPSTSTRSPLSPRSNLIRYSNSPSPTREQASKPSEGDLARIDHERIIYGALLEDCPDNRGCSGIPEGCLKAHYWSSWQTVRRDPRIFNYGSKLCSFFAEGSCQKGDQCSFAHSKTEVQFHPKVYKTQACNRYPGSRYCGNTLCAFYHVFADGSDDSRKPPDIQSEGIVGTSPEDNVWLDRSPGFRNFKESVILDHSSSVPASPRFGPQQCSSLLKSHNGHVRPFSSLMSNLSFNESCFHDPPSVWKPTWRRSLERSTSEMKVGDRLAYSEYQDSGNLREHFLTPSSFQNVQTSKVGPTEVSSNYEAAHRHWALDHLDQKMKNPNRKESQFGLNLLAWVPDFPLRELIKLLSDEIWTVEQLRSYLSHTLVRALEEKKVVVAESGKYAAFNTGLSPPNSTYSMIALLTYSPVQQGTKFEWTLTHFHSPSEIGVGRTIPMIPLPVCYLDGKSDMWFDVNKPMKQFGEQLLARVMDRISEVRPDFVNYDPFIQMATLEKAMKNAERNASLNPQHAVPSFYRPKGQLFGSVQFLLPISFTDDPSKVDGALAVQERSNGYVACTVLSLQDAYAHARLIGKPSASWLSANIPAEDTTSGTRICSFDEKLSLDKYGSIQLFYQENSIPRLVGFPSDEKTSDSQIYEDILGFARKCDIKELSTHKVENANKVYWEIYLNHFDFISILRKFGRMSALECYTKRFSQL